MDKSFFRKKSNLILYEKFKLNKNLSIKKDDILAEKHSPNVLKVKKIRKYIEDRIPIAIVVSSLYSNSGCSFISNKFADYLKSLNYNVLLFNKDNYNPDGLKECNFFIIDIGKYKDISKPLEVIVSQAHIKIMVSLSSNIYLKELSQFIKSYIDSNQWKYFFNLVPQKECKKISTMMEDYENYIVPTLNLGNFEDEKELRNCFKSVLLTKV